MKKYVNTDFLMGIFVGIIACILFMPKECKAYTSEALAYTVKKGDTLYLIGKEYGKTWEELAEINKLQVEYKDKIPYVWLKVGQEILLEWPKKELTLDEITEYMDATKLWMEDTVFKMAIIREPIPRFNRGVVTIPLDLGDPRGSELRIKEWTKVLRHQQRYQIVDEIYAEALKSIGKFKYFEDEKFWESHRKICIMMMAVLDTESDGYFAIGSHGERGPWQVRPRTYCEFRGWKTTADNIRRSREILSNSSREGLHCGMDRLSRKEELLNALAYYNGYGVQANRYASKVHQRYVRMLRELDG